MPTQRLVHHLRKFRKGAGLSQRDLARLLGWRGRARVADYEQFISLPSLRTAISYELIFGVPLRDLLPGLYAEVGSRLARHAETLLPRTAANTARHRDAKRAFLAALATVATNPPHDETAQVLDASRSD